MSQNSLDWVPLELLRNRFDANIAALETRYPEAAARLNALEPAEPYFIRPEGDLVHLAVGEARRPVPGSLPPHVALAIINKMFPEGKCNEASLIAGEDMGWLWNGLYRLPFDHSVAPGYRPPLFFLMQNLERLRVILHVQDWQQMLADQRVRLFFGQNIVRKFEQSLQSDVMCPWPKLSVTVDPGIWPEGVTLDSVVAAARKEQSNTLVNLLDRIDKRPGKPTPAHLAGLIRVGSPLRILGLTSRYTTFLQYSMRDWLAGLERLGHQTRLFVEECDHQVPNNLAIALACAEFKPDLMIAIDHSRPMMFGVLQEVPCVMWVQDRLPSIFNRKAGEGMGPTDYVIGYARQELTQRFGFPAARFMPAMVGVNDLRFSPRELTAGERERFGCDVSFVSHASTPADQIIHSEKKRQDKPEARALLDDLYGQLQAIYDAGSFVSSGDILEQLIDSTLLRLGLTGSREGIMNLFAHQVNNALFRHQAVRWAAESGANLHLYGKGWENHPEFARHARGVADNQDMLPVIYQASAINLQVTPFGAVHQRLLDGLAAGGFFLLRSVTADALEVLRKQIWEWCQARMVTNGPQMIQRCDPQLTALLDRFTAIAVTDPRSDIDYFYAGLEEASMNDFQRTANTMWIESPRVTFATRAQLIGQIQHFLANSQERRAIAASMRQRVLETHTYRAISRQMLDFIASDIERSTRKSAAA